MNDLLKTVRYRYTRVTGYRGITTLIHRTDKREAEPEPEEQQKRGIFDFLRPQFTGVSRKIHNEVEKVLDKRDKIILQTVSREVPNLVNRQLSQFRTENERASRTRLDLIKRAEKRVDTFQTEITARMKTVQRELDVIKNTEKSRVREQELTPREDQPLTYRTAKRIATERAVTEREDFRRELDESVAVTERRIMRKLRDGDAYDKRRRG